MPKKKNKPRVALVYDKVNTPFGGAEVVITAISELFPEAPLYTSVYNKNKATWAKNIQIIPSFLQKIPFFSNKHQLLFPLMPLAFESFDFSQFDLIISITSAEAKGILTKPEQTHMCYLLTPTRYLYSHKETYGRSKPILQNPVFKWLLKKILQYISFWDYSASKRPDVLIPISKLVSKRILTYYKRKPGKVVYPPVSINLSKNDLEKIQVLDIPPFYLSVSRLVDYKRIDVSIQACMELKKTLIIAGIGESMEKLTIQAGNSVLQRNQCETLTNFIKRAQKTNKTILFTGKLSQENIHVLYKNCQALLMPGQEDFGITALEAGIFAKPVVVFYTSGVSELLIDTKHAVFIRKETVEEMIYALGKIDSLEFNADELRSNALKHSIDIFKQEFKDKIKQELKGQYVIS